MKLSALLTGLLFICIPGCSFIEPVCLSIENKSDYTIHVSIDRGLKEDFSLTKKKGGFTLLYPGRAEVTISIPELGFSRHYQVDLAFNEKKTLEFYLEK